MTWFLTADQAKSCATWASAAFALLAAVLWWQSSSATVYAAQHLKLTPGSYTDGWDDGAIAQDAKGRNYDVIATAIRQGYWNRLAALAACVSAALQAISVIVPGD
jgi:hypothetical protein